MGNPRRVEVLVEHEREGVRVADPTCDVEGLVGDREGPVRRGTGERAQLEGQQRRGGEPAPSLSSGPMARSAASMQLDALGVDAGHVADAAPVGEHRLDQALDVAERLGATGRVDEVLAVLAEAERPLGLPRQVERVAPQDVVVDAVEKLERGFGQAFASSERECELRLARGGHVVPHGPLDVAPAGRGQTEVVREGDHVVGLRRLIASPTRRCRRTRAVRPISSYRVERTSVCENRYDPMPVSTSSLAVTASSSASTRSSSSWPSVSASTWRVKSIPTTDHRSVSLATVGEMGETSAHDLPHALRDADLWMGPSTAHRPSRRAIAPDSWRWRSTSRAKNGLPSVSA